jgi:subtilase family serine protease
VKSNRSRAVRLGILAALVTLVITAAAVTASAHRTAARSGGMTPAVVQGGPQYQLIGPVTAPETSPTVPFGCQTRPVSAFPASSCYGPDQIRNAYGIQKLLDKGIDGRGRSITIVDAYGSPHIQTELGTFDATFGIPDPTLNIIYPDGPPLPTDPDNAFGWAVETALDVQWAHAVAPGATINLVVAKSNDDADILSATQYVYDHRVGDVLSQSFGENEACMDSALLQKQNKLFAKMTDRGFTLLASAGDDGAGNASCDGSTVVKSTSTPATDPNVTAVGGTTLFASSATRDPVTFQTLNPGGAYQDETVWNEYAWFGDRTSTGGGVSSLYRKPDYQFLVSSLRRERMRWIPDIAYNAAIQGGVITVAFCPAFVCGADGLAAFRVGGTSAGSPQWAGLTALAAQLAHGRIGSLNPVLYVLGATPFASAVYHDVTVGNNTVPADFTGTGTEITGYSAGKGWDAVTGWGTPRADRLVPILAASRFFHGGDH